MQVQNDCHPWNVRALLESTATPFTIADYGPRAAIFRQGDPCDSVMHIERGRVWLAVTARSGKEAICGLLDTGAFLGEEALTGCGERRQSATAMTATQVLVVAKAHMIRPFRTQPGLVDRFIAHLLARNIRLEANLTDQIVVLVLLFGGGGGYLLRPRCWMGRAALRGRLARSCVDDPVDPLAHRPHGRWHDDPLDVRPRALN